MSRQINRNRKNKNLSGFELKTADEVYFRIKKNRYIVKKGIKVFGRIEKTSPFVVKKGPKNEKYSYVEDVSNLPKNLKNKIVQELYDEKSKRRVLYLVEK